MQLSYRLLSGVLFLASVIGMTFALYLEHVQGLAPCPLCVFQRVGLIALGLVSLIAFVHNPKSNVVKRIYALLGSIGILWSVGVAARHVWLQNLTARSSAKLRSRARLFGRCLTHESRIATSAVGFR